MESGTDDQLCASGRAGSALSVNPKVVSKRLGHSSVAFTLDTYAHVVPGMAPEAASRFSDLVFANGSRDIEEDGR